MSTRYVDDGTTFAFLLVLLSFASYLPAEVEHRASAAAGAAVLGLALFQPAVLAFDHLGAGAWLAVCAALVPIGGLLAWEGNEGRVPARSGAGPAGPAPALLAAAGLGLVLAGLWLPADSGGATFWDLSSSGHALGILMLVAACLAGGLVVAATLAPGNILAHGALLAGTATFGLLEAPLVRAAFEGFGSLGSGAWVEAAGGAVLLGAAALAGALARPAAAGRAVAAVSD